MFDTAKFQTARKGDFGASLQIFQEIDSTNRVAADLAKKNVKEGMIIFAESQSHGRGRENHTWYSPKGENLYFTLILYPPASRLHYLPFLTGLSIVETLEECGVDCELKWPNDILVAGKKIAGILIQTSMEENRLAYAIVGIGINLNTKEFPSELQSVAISAVQIIAKNVDREKFLAALLSKIEHRYQNISDLSWEDLVEQVQQKSSFLRDCEVQIERGGSITIGTTAGLDSMGGLIVRTKLGEEVFYAGEIQACRKR
jgi:BirA family biotin operon repressor/biotin-[acetyl-CoA-carboxylase] ligase